MAPEVLWKLDHIIRHLHAIMAQNDLILAAVQQNDPATIADLTNKLKASSDALKSSIDANSSVAVSLPHVTSKESLVNPILQNLSDQVTASTTVEASAVTLINGFAARVQAAVDAALAGGATAAQLAPIQAEVDAMKASAQALSDAVAANTPAAPAAKKKP